VQQPASNEQSSHPKRFFRLGAAYNPMWRNPTCESPILAGRPAGRIQVPVPLVDRLGSGGAERRLRGGPRLPIAARHHHADRQSGLARRAGVQDCEW